MGVIRELITKITFKSDKGSLKTIDKQTRNVKRRMSSAAREARKFRRNMNQLATAAKAYVAAVAASRSVKLVTTDVVSEIKEAKKHADALGESFEKFGGLAVIARKQGVEMEDLFDAMKEGAVKVNDAFGLAASKDAQELLKQMGIRKDQVIGTNGKLKKTSEILMVVADAYKNMGDRSKAAAAIDDLLGDVGSRMSKLLLLGREGIQEAVKQARANGEIWSPETVAAALKYTKAKKQMMGVLISLRNFIAAKLLPGIADNLQAFARWAFEGQNLQKVFDRVISTLRLMVPVLASVVLYMKRGVILQFGQSVAGAARALVLMGKGAIFAKLKLGLLLAAFAIVFDVIQLARGQDSILGRMFADSPETLATLKALGTEIMALGKEALSALLPIAKDLMAALAPVARELLTALKPIIGTVLKVLVIGLRIAVKLIKPLAKLLVPIVKLLGVVVGGLLKAIGALMDAVGWVFEKLGVDWDKFDTAIRYTVAYLGQALEKIGDVIGWIADKLGPAFVLAGKAASAAWAGVKAIFESSKQTIQWIVDKGERAARFLGQKHTTHGLSPEEMAAMDAKNRAAGSAVASRFFGVNRSVNVGSVPITVNAAPNMSPEELRRATVGAAKEALQSLVTDTYRGRAET